MNERPFRILGIQQVAIGGQDKARLRSLWVDTLGVPSVGSYRSERENVDEDILALGERARRVEVDLMQPLDRGEEAGRARSARSITSDSGWMTSRRR